MYTSAYYLLQNSNYLNCIRRFVHSNECSNSTKFVWALVSIYCSGLLDWLFLFWKSFYVTSACIPLIICVIRLSFVDLQCDLWFIWINKLEALFGSTISLIFEKLYRQVSSHVKSRVSRNLSFRWKLTKEENTWMYNWILWCTYLYITTFKSTSLSCYYSSP